MTEEEQKDLLKDLLEDVKDTEDSIVRSKETIRVERVYIAQDYEKLALLYKQLYGNNIQ